MVLKFNKANFRTLTDNIKSHFHTYNSDYVWTLSDQSHFIVVSQQEREQIQAGDSIYWSPLVRKAQKKNEDIDVSYAEACSITEFIWTERRHGVPIHFDDYLTSIESIIDEAIELGHSLTQVKDELENNLQNRHSLIIQQCQDLDLDNFTEMLTFVDSHKVAGFDTFLKHYNELTSEQKFVRDSIQRIYDKIVAEQDLFDLKNYLFSVSLDDAVVTTTIYSEIMFISNILPNDVAHCGRLIAFMAGNDPMTKLGSITTNQLTRKVQEFMRSNGLLDIDFYSQFGSHMRGTTPAASNQVPHQSGDHGPTPSQSSTSGGTDTPTDPSSSQLDPARQFQNLTSIYGTDVPPVPISRNDGESDDDFAHRLLDYHNAVRDWAARHGVSIPTPAQVPLPTTPPPPAIPDDDNYEPDYLLAPLAKGIRKLVLQGDPNDMSHDHMTRFNTTTETATSVSSLQVRRGRQSFDYTVQSNIRGVRTNYVVTFTRKNKKPIFNVIV